MKKIDVILGLQWGDEGKGKIVDVLTPQYDIIARFQGGPNAGHTLEFNGRKHVLHIIPSGIFHERTINIIGNGVVIEPVIFMSEIEEILTHKTDPYKNLVISRKAHLIAPSHRLLDAAMEESKGMQKIGSTLKGIGPCYTDKTSRSGIRTGDIFSVNFLQKYDELKRNHLKIIDSYKFNYEDFRIDGLRFSDYESKWIDAVNKIRNFRYDDTEYLINRELDNHKSVLAEGAQGTMLDIDFGSYPYVTSSSTIAAGVCTGLGVPPSRIGKVMGVFKAYCTRVGGGPFLTELNDDTGQLLRDRGHEYGSTTGRPRRCGWLDLPALKYAVMLDGVTELIMTKPDVMSGLGEISVCSSYHVDGQTTSIIPYDLLSGNMTPVYEQVKAWQEDLTGMQTEEELPVNLKNYVEIVEKETGVPVSMISVGPDRLQTVYIKNRG